MKRLTIFIVLLVGITAIWLWSTSDSHRVFINGEIFTVNDKNDVVEAISIRNGLIEAVGSNNEILALKQTDTIVTDLKGRSLLPGFIDAHSHFPVSGVHAVSVNLYPPPIGEVDTIDKLLERIAIAARQTDEKDWLVGFGYDDSLITPARHPNRQELDGISSEIPIFLWHQSGHFAVVNSAGLDKLGITEDTPNPTGGEYGRDPVTGKLNGRLIEHAAPGLDTIFKDGSIFDYYTIFNSAIEEYLSYGITTAHSGATPLNLTRGLYWASKLRILPFRVVVLPRYSAFESGIPERIRRNDKRVSSRFRLGPVKLFADGSPQGYTAYLSEPYHIQPPGETDYRGYPAESLESLANKMKHINDEGQQIAVHVNGDASIDLAIDAFNQSGIDPNSDHRTILLHAQMLREDQIPVVKELGMTPSFFTTHTYYFGDLHSNKVMGPSRAAKISPAASAMKAGLRISLHSDAPVTPINQLQIIWSAMERQTLSGKILGEEERIELHDAVRGITLDAAWQIFEDTRRGSLQIGKVADLVILSGSLQKYSGDIRNLSIDETIVGGKSVFLRTKQ